MARRYYADGKGTVFISSGPEQHNAARKSGFVQFSPYDYIRWGEDLHPARETAPGYTKTDLQFVTNLGKAGHNGTVVKTVDSGGTEIRYVGEEFVKVGRGKWELQNPKY